ncbi:MAG: hypothetical protein K8F24_07685, partial [Bacteroidales bacterium]|nr:hypothetical protein [Bacteroidales bacterium]
VYTSGLKPDVTCLDCLPNEKVVFRQEQYTPDPGRENMNKYNIYYDISNVPIRHVTQRTFRIITWNSFRNPEGDWAGTLVTYPTDNLNFQITVPLTKKFKDLRFGTRPRGANSDAPISNPLFSINQDSTMVDFSFKNPEIKKSYRIKWHW